MHKEYEGWFALFCTATISLEKINDILIKACDGAAYESLKKPWYFWLATENFNAVQPPAKRPDGSDIMATEGPVKEYTSSHQGKNLDTLAKELQNASDKTWINRVYFAVVDERTAADGSIVLCRIEDDGSIDTLRAWPKHASLYLRAMNGFRWGELKDSWGYHKKQDGNDVLD